MFPSYEGIFPHQKMTERERREEETDRQTETLRKRRGGGHTGVEKGAGERASRRQTEFKHQT
jgi:hypothetical protein